MIVLPVILLLLCRCFCVSLFSRLSFRKRAAVFSRPHSSIVAAPVEQKLCCGIQIMEAVVLFELDSSGLGFAENSFLRHVPEQRAHGLHFLRSVCLHGCPGENFNALRVHIEGPRIDCRSSEYDHVIIFCHFD